MKVGKPDDLIDWLKPGSRIYLQGGSGECTAFIDLLKANPGAARGVELWSCLIPGINTFDYGSLPDGPDLVTFMASPALGPSIASGRTRLKAMPYSEIGALLSRTSFDIAIFHAAPPGPNGLCSLGIACDAAAIVWPRAARRAAFINELMPSIPRADAISSDRLDLAISANTPLLAPAPSGGRSKALQSIASIAAGLVPDAVTIQSGIGEAPGAVIAALKGHKRLRIHSGILTPEYRLLDESGALDPEAQHIAGIAWGDAPFYNWLKSSGIAFRSTLETHARDKLAAIADFTSIGSAIEVDLAGNLNLEWRDGRRISSVGGAPDYMHGAATSRGGRSIIALPSTAGNGASRVVPSLETASIGAGLADWIVSEHGAAHLRGKSAEARADAMITIAAPQHRERLAVEWEMLARSSATRR